MGDRLQKIGNEIAKELAPILDDASRQLLSGAMITIMEVKVSPDLGMAKVYISVFNAPDKQLVMETLEKKKPVIRKYLGQQMRHTLRRIPEIQFAMDETIDTAQRIESLLKNIQKKDPDKD